MKNSYLFLGLIGLGLSLSACSNAEVKTLRDRVEEQQKAILDLQTRLKAQEDFSTKAKEVIAEHRTHIQGIEAMMAKSKGIKRPTKKR